MPSDNLMTMLRAGGARCPTGKKGATFKRQTQSGLVVNESGWPIVTGSGPINYSDAIALTDESDFTKHEAAAVKMGSMLFVKRAPVGQSKHRARPAALRSMDGTRNDHRF